jgi:hypothetical protein
VKNLSHTVDFGLAVWALRSAFVAGRMTPMGALLLLPTAVSLARDGAHYLRERRKLRQVVRRVR